MNNNLFCITSHCDTGEKLQLLKNNIAKLKERGYDILLFSHIPLSSKITSSVNYFIYDKSNPILKYPNKYMTFWKTINNGVDSYKLTSHLPDYGWTHLNQIIKISDFSKSLDYNQYTFINYDIQITDGIRSDHHYNVLSNVKWPDGKVKFPSLVFFSLSKDDLETVSNSLVLGEYISNEWVDAEDFFDKKCLDKIDFEIHPEDVVEDMEYKDFDDEYIWNLNTDNDIFQLYFDNIDPYMGDPQTKMLLYGFKRDEIKFNIDGEDITIKDFTLVKKPSKSFGYYIKDELLIDLTYLLNNDRITHIKIEDINE